MSIAYLNGEYLALEEATLSVMDRGFLFSDGVYEVIPIYNNHAFRLEEHLKRLSQGLTEIYIDFNVLELKDIIQELVVKNAFQLEQAVYLQVTRGVAMIRDHKIPSDILPSTFAYCMSMPHRDVAAIANGAYAITVEDIRWGRCDIKSTNLLPNILMRQKAAEVNAEEAIFVAQGLVFEGTSTNVFMVKDGTLTTPPLGRKVLGGITRELVLELAAANDIKCLEENIYQDAFLEADEIWLTSSTKEILPVTRVDNTLIGGGQIGELWFKVMAWYQDYKKCLLQS